MKHAIFKNADGKVETRITADDEGFGITAKEGDAGPRIWWDRRKYTVERQPGCDEAWEIVRITPKQ